MNALAHAGQSWHANRGFFIDWCFLRCTEMKLRDPVNYIRSEWIRPEDLRLYEEMGYDLFKVTERDLPTPVMVNRVRAYAARRYDGNLLDLVQPYALREDREQYYRRGSGAAALPAGDGEPGPDAPAEAAGGPVAHDPSGDGRASVVVATVRSTGSWSGSGKRGAATRSAKRAAGATISRRRRSGSTRRRADGRWRRMTICSAPSTAGRCGDIFQAGRGSP
jgi:hypothetical protein